MTKHRTITGFVAVALLAVAVTAATMRSHSPWTDGLLVAAGTTMLKASRSRRTSSRLRVLTTAGSRYPLRQRTQVSEARGSLSAAGLLGENCNGPLVVGRRFRVTGRGRAARMTR